MYTSPAAVMRTRCGLLPTATCCESFTSCPKATTSALIATIAPNNHGTACTAYNRIRFQGRSEQPLIHLVILYLLSDTSLLSHYFRESGDSALDTSMCGIQGASKRRTSQHRPGRGPRAALFESDAPIHLLCPTAQRGSAAWA